MADQTLIQFLLSLFDDEEQLAAFQANPDAFLASCGFTDLEPGEVQDALVLLNDSHDASFDRDYNTGGNHHPHIPPPPHPKPGEDSHDVAVKYLNTYVTNNYVDDRDTIVDNSINQNIDNRGGIFNQDIDVDSVVASGDGSVAAGGDIEDSTITTGNDNVVGNGNDVVKGDGNTTAFGNGDAVSTGDLTTGNGGAISFGGNASGNDADTNVANFGDGDTNVATASNGSTAAQANAHVDDDSTTTTTTTTNSNNETNVDVDDAFNTETDVDILSNNDVLSHNDVASGNSGGSGTGADGVDIV
ncbi:IniB N-terminal domain-containing protein [Pseudonocardia sp. N23]|uniref:IniB N-terminal domain-containing protein n=1 Tax=Pseudonocardia sp. N23 TaxID=1987376 RepID=UPI000BFE4486|nr:IniB N-terminal domain-containing protein [Pseudonocardia sp. N23]GAY11082.1 Dentin sialophosphoprotein precursor [Pseudonocardia sp. N23]